MKIKHEFLGKSLTRMLTVEGTFLYAQAGPFRVVFSRPNARAIWKASVQVTWKGTMPWPIADLSCGKRLKDAVQKANDEARSFHNATRRAVNPRN